MDHTGHSIAYYEEQIVCRDVVEVLPNGNVEGHYKEFVDEISDVYLLCRTCGVRINGTDIGASEDWEIELNGC
jgi:hypothetical protein